MRDTTVLRRRLESLIGIATLALGTTACDRAETTTQAGPDPTVTPKTTKTATTESVPVPTASTSAVPTGPIVGLPTGGGCPPWDWCGPAADAKAHAKPGSTTKLGCTVELEHNAKAPSASTMSFAYAELDETKTKDARADAGTPGTCCYTMHRLCGGGRPLIDGDEARVADVREGKAWHASLALGPASSLDAAERQTLGERWLRDARIEHASVASFARAALELMAIGAPAELVAECHRAALDEVRHAEACFAIASHLLGHDVEPGPLTLPAMRACTLVDVACSTLLEGCCGETASALIATRMAAQCDDVAIRAVLEGLARDEAGHAALAFRIVRWCVAQGGPEVVEALRRAPVLPGEAFDEIVRPLLASLDIVSTPSAASAADVAVCL